MYGALWNAIPGPWWVRLIVMLALAAAVVAVCFEWVFPWLSEYMPLNQQTVGE
ncbi:hypothetical protein CLV28_2622 [Sediminihabitans luteus]|uniref:Uncharacterized protein n=1 Tax=Sediminihabitans luteus TaxID=1138585 RepID=A0A2M9CCX4_9CELL|nr:hypothetical protein [Sediminihabitans luteus]PJJ69163.1 hypothetical protein CLV28_2622 [Sediminihabitans luteus]GII98835.1 hypothetical protein Slu03_12130 [Sediminihabitans luteus]